MGKKAKKFALALIQADQGPVIAEFTGQGLVEFPVRDPGLEEVLEFRAWASRKFADAEEMEDQGSLVFRMIIRMVKAAIDEELTDDDALAIVKSTGGPMSPFVYELARRCGVSDILKPARPSDGGTFQNEIPT